MNVFSRLLQTDCFRAVRWLLRFRHRKGYGIHSPFAFSFVRDVVYETTPFYAYTPLHRLRARASSPLREKDDRLLFRLANFSEARRIVVVGEEADVETSVAYIRAARPNAQIAVVPFADDAALTDAISQMQAVDLAYLAPRVGTNWGSAWATVMQNASPRAVLAVYGIGFEWASCRTWHEAIADNRVRVTFNLSDFGVAFLESRFFKEDHIVDYW